MSRTRRSGVDNGMPMPMPMRQALNERRDLMLS